MQDNNIDAYIIPTNDYHMSEYVSDFFKSRAFLSGFNGSAGTLVVTKEKAYLWTDGRYFIQAANQIDEKYIELMKMGQPDVPDINEFLADYFKIEGNNKLGFDGKVMATSDVLRIKKAIPENVYISSRTDLINLVWNDRPELPYSLIYKLSKFFTGKNYSDKLKDVREILAKDNIDVYVLSSLEDQAWLYNLRANDVSHTPVFLAYTVITPQNTILFTDNKKIDLVVEKYLNENNIILKEYNEIYDYLKGIKEKRVQLNFKKANYELYNSLLGKDNIIIDKEDPTLLMKAIKNKTEIKNIKIAHERDGVAMTKFMYYLKNNFGKTDMTELSLSDYLEKLRKKNKGFVDLSFNTICAFNEHAAMMHYSATKESSSKVEKGGLLLVDSGGHYMEGTTDITRTFALGKVSDIMKTHFTTVLKSVIALDQAVFMKGCTGQNLDILARGPIWKLGIDYKCGTGHGVGYLLSVHEAPNGFRWKIVPERNDSCELQPGMITTDEPGIYLENKYGIRTENELLCVERESNEWGTFYGFETITYCPIDLDAIKPNLLTKEEKDWLNNYHKNVYDILSPSLNDEEREWLKEYTRKI